MTICLSPFEGVFSASQELTSKAFYVRCYGHLTGRRVPFQDPQYQLVQQGQVDALAVCNELLNRPQMNSSGMLANVNDSTARLILSHFYDLQRSWFTAVRFEDAIPMNDFTRATYDVYDTTMGGLFLTYLLFAQGQNFSQVMTSNNGVYAVRKAGTTNAYSKTGAYTRNIIDNIYVNFPAFEPIFQAGYKYSPTTRNANDEVPQPNQVWNPNTSTITIGELHGITPFGVASTGNPGNGPEPEPAIVPISFLTPFALMGLISLAVEGATVPNFQGSFNIRQSLGRGAGLIGTREYLMLNVGYDFDFQSDGALKVFRRWSKNLMSDLLCRELPVLRTQDVKEFISPIANAAPFRKSTNCLRCHATMDPMAYTARNLRWVNANESSTADPRLHGMNTSHLSTYNPVVNVPFAWTETPVAGFHTQTPRGRLYFRSFNGELIDRSVGNMAELGQALSQTDDLYTCAAKRHFQAMTGINVVLYDMGDAGNSALNKGMSEKDFEYRQFVIKLGRHLRETGSLKSMIREIMASRYYSLSDYGKSEEVDLAP